LLGGGQKEPYSEVLMATSSGTIETGRIHEEFSDFIKSYFKEKYRSLILFNGD
jgi:hypothetical protein